MLMIDYKGLIFVFSVNIVSIIFSLVLEYKSTPKDQDLALLPRFLRNHSSMWGLILASFAIPLSVVLPSPGLLKVSHFPPLDSRYFILMTEIILIIIIIPMAKHVRSEELASKGDFLMCCQSETRRDIRATTRAAYECFICQSSDYRGIHIPHWAIEYRLNPDAPDNIRYKRILNTLELRVLGVGLLGSVMLFVALIGFVIKIK